MSIDYIKQSNNSLETTRKKTLQIMHKGMISYKLSNLGWDVSEHLGDGYDLLCTKKTPNSYIIQIELKGIDISSYSEKATGFSQSLSENEISTASHLIVSIFEGIHPSGHYIMTLRQMFDKIKGKGTNKYARFKSFYEYREKASELALEKANRKKGEKKKLDRMFIDIGCSFKKYKSSRWELEEFSDKWANLELTN